MTSLIFDSLPYYDNDLDLYPNLREKVEKELAREGKPPQTLHPKVPLPIELFTVCMKCCEGYTFYEPLTFHRKILC
jgi:Breast carcinoma amplified sequence 2 (BCAS2)